MRVLDVNGYIWKCPHCGKLITDVANDDIKTAWRLVMYSKYVDCPSCGSKIFLREDRVHYEG